MANTTNFGWETPDDTDLVKDGASAMRTLGNAIDTSLVDLKGGTTGQVLSKASNTDMDFTWSSVDPLTILDAKGDLISATAADTPARLAVGTNGQYLSADSTASTGLKWVDAPASGSLTSLATGTLSSTSVSISSINQTYQHLYLVVSSPQINTGTAYLMARINGNTGSNYQLSGFTNGNTFVVGTAITYANWTVDTIYSFGTAANNQIYTLFLPNYTMTKGKSFVLTYNNPTNTDFGYGWGNFSSNSAITSLSISTTAGTGTMSVGTYTLYGVK